jgi:prefoldin beta subunit
VKKEFDLLDDSSRVFKLNGPVLVKQDVSEAKVTVINRLKFFQAEM